MSVPTDKMPHTAAPAPPRAAPRAAPKAAEKAPSGMSSASSLADMARALKSEQAQYAPQIEAANQRMSEDQALLHNYQADLSHTWETMQRQRLITLNRAQVLRKMLPVIGIMALLAGKADGVTGATAALAGAFAGLNKGEEDQFQRAYKEYTVQYNRMMSHAKMVQENIRSVLEDNSKTMQQKIDMVKAMSAGVAMFDRTMIDHNDRQQGMQMAHHDRLYWYGQQLDEFNRKLDKTDSLFKRSQKAMETATPGDITNVMDTLMPNGVPFTPPKGDVQHLGKPTPAQISAARRAAETRWHNTFAQVAILAKHYMFSHPNVDMQTAIQKVGDTLRSQDLLKGPSQNIPMTQIEAQMGDVMDVYVGKGKDGKPKKITGAELKSVAEDQGVTVESLIKKFGLTPEK